MVMKSVAQGYSFGLSARGYSRLWPSAGSNQDRRVRGHDLNASDPTLKAIFDVQSAQNTRNSLGSSAMSAAGMGQAGGWKSKGSFLCFRKDSIPEGVKRGLTEDESPFFFGEGFRASGDVEVVQRSGEVVIVEFLLEFGSGFILDRQFTCASVLPPTSGLMMLVSNWCFSYTTS